MERDIKTRTNRGKYDLEQRTFVFAKDCRELVKLLKRTIANIEDGKQLTRSSGSVAANYIEANESLSKKDFIMRIKICKKESKESRLWLRLLEITENDLISKRERLFDESSQLVNIFGSILVKSK